MTLHIENCHFCDTLDQGIKITFIFWQYSIPIQTCPALRRKCTLRSKCLNTVDYDELFSLVGTWIRILQWSTKYLQNDKVDRIKWQNYKFSQRIFLSVPVNDRCFLTPLGFRVFHCVHIRRVFLILRRKNKQRLFVIIRHKSHINFVSVVKFLNCNQYKYSKQLIILPFKISRENSFE